MPLSGAGFELRDRAPRARCHSPQSSSHLILHRRPTSGHWNQISRRVRLGPATLPDQPVDQRLTIDIDETLEQHGPVASQADYTVNDAFVERPALAAGVEDVGDFGVGVWSRRSWTPA